MMTNEKIKNSSELEFAVFCIENVAAKLGVDAERVYQAFTEQSPLTEVSDMAVMAVSCVICGMSSWPATSGPTCAVSPSTAILPKNSRS